MTSSARRLGLCIDNTDYQASLVLGKIYPVLPDPEAGRDELVCIVDESGEDYLYHRDYFLFNDSPSGGNEKDSEGGARCQS